MRRLADIFGAVFWLILLSPLLLGLFCLVRWKLGKPALFRQWRPGLRAQPFRLVKFRTMHEARDAQGQLLPDALRTPALGHWLRRSSLDELPELWNILRGEMSFIGPRPLLMDYLPLYTPRQRKRQLVRPGLTGWAQIQGRAHMPWAERLEADVWYVEHRSLWLDLRILAETVWMLLSRRDTSVAPEVGPFCGTQPQSAEPKR